MSRRRSQSTPLARSDGPVTPKAIASSALRWATFFRRSIQMRFPVRRFSYSSTFSGKIFRNFLTASKKPIGGAHPSPPKRGDEIILRGAPTPPYTPDPASRSPKHTQQPHPPPPPPPPPAPHPPPTST